MLIVPAGMVEDRMTSVWLLAISLSGLRVASPNTWTLTQAVCSKNLVGTVSGIQNFGGNVFLIGQAALTEDPALHPVAAGVPAGRNVRILFCLRHGRPV
ncbi:MAG: hypothetical protein ACR2G5_16190 [Pyrinomonadaceae bacterium]